MAENEEILGNEEEVDFAFLFENGTYIEAKEGEDGITVHVEEEDEEPKIGTFTDFETMLYNLAPVVQKCGNDDEFSEFVTNIKYSFGSDMSLDEIAEILLK